MTAEVREELREQLEYQKRWEQMTPEQKKEQLFQKQKELLDTFLSRNAISKAQYDYSLGCLIRQMG